MIASGWDVVGSRDFGRFIYDGDSAPPGSGRIAQLFCAYFAAHRQASVELSLGGSSDHAPFADASIAIGGLFTGADERKPATLARLFGGRDR